MATDEAKAQDWKAKILGEIVGHLKGYPFILAAMGMAIIFLFIFPFLDGNKLAIAFIIFLVVAVLCILFQFVLEIKKLKKAPTGNAVHGADRANSIALQRPQGFSGKAITSLIMSLLILLGFGGLSPKELGDIQIQIVLLIFAMVAGVLGFSAWHDTRANKVRGGGTAVAGSLLSSILILASWGWITQKHVPPEYLPKVAHTANAVEAQINLQQGLNYARSRDWAQAVNEFSLAIQKDPNNAPAHANRAIVYMQLGKFDMAQQDLNEAVRIAPIDSDAHYNLVALYSLQKQAVLALEELDRTLGTGFKNTDALRGDPDLAYLRAQPEFRKVLEKHKIFLN